MPKFAARFEALLNAATRLLSTHPLLGTGAEKRAESRFVTNVMDQDQAEEEAWLELALPLERTLEILGLMTLRVSHS